MNITTNTNAVKHFITTFSLCCLGLSTQIFAMEEADLVSQSPEILTTAKTPDIVINEMKESAEKIEVVGQKPLLFFKQQMQMAELDFYSLFNAIATEEKFKVKCRQESRIGSRIKTTACYPQYVLDRMAIETQNALRSGAPFPSLSDVEFLVQREKEDSLKYVEQVVSQNPDLLKKLVDMNEKKLQYNQKKKAAG